MSAERAAARPAVGKQTRVELEDVAQQGTEGAGGRLPHYERIQAAFGRHDVSGVRAHQGPAATMAAHTLGARAYAHGNAVAFAGAPELHTAAHEAAHVVQQRAGVQLAGGIDQPGDSHERHADEVADAVVAGLSAEALLDQRAPDATARGGAAAIQRDSTPAQDDAWWLLNQTFGAAFGDPGAAPSDASRLFSDPDPDPGSAPLQTEVHFVAGRTNRCALVIGGVHGSEPEGEVVVRKLIEALKTAPTKPYFTVILIPRLIAKAREDASPKSQNAPFREVSDKTAKGNAGASSKGTGSEGNIEVEPNRNFPMPGTSYDTYKKTGHLEFEDPKTKVVRPPQDVVKLDGKKERRAKAVASEKMLPENRMLVHLIEMFKPERLASVHQHSVPGSRGDGPGVFVDPRRPPDKRSADDGVDPTTDRALTPEGLQDDKLGEAMRDSIRDGAEKAGLRKDGLDPLAGNAVPLPGKPSRGKPTVHYNTSAHAEGNSLGDYAPVEVKEGHFTDRPAIGTITIELPQYGKSRAEQDALAKLEVLEVEALQQIFLGDPAVAKP